MVDTTGKNLGLCYLPCNVTLLEAKKRMDPGSVPYFSCLPTPDPFTSPYSIS